MSGSTEVYVCYEGQKLKEGKLEYSGVSGKEEAQEDAERRVARDPKIHKIAYYSVDPSGRFRNFYTYTNPNPVSAGNARSGGRATGMTREASPRRTGATAPPRKAATAKTARKMSLKERIIDFFMVEEK
ncbi:MAG TPA: hypothetical protein VEB64_00900 [Azospirillaceae bacterium]|nr:hypothetical protein [Azospirillaceae bacterium]